MHVTETVAIANESGLFDNGFHRQLDIRPITPQRTKIGLFESLDATIDGHLVVLQTSIDGNVFNIDIAPENGRLSRGNHVIELNYAAKYQFAIYRDSQDLNTNITGEWPVSIEKAAVELDFPAGLPKDFGVSANTGANSNFHFDCIRTTLPSGVRFESTHTLPPSNRLFVSARFIDSGYFVSSFEDDGYRAILENHPLLKPVLISVAGTIAFAIAGVVVWRRAPEGTAIDPTRSLDVVAMPRYWRETKRTYGFPMVMFALAIIPGFNFTYSGHGGPCWFLLPLCFPWVLARLLVKIAVSPEAHRTWYKDFFKATVPRYIAVSLPLSWAATASIQIVFGLQVSPWSFFAMMVSPFPWWYFS